MEDPLGLVMTGGGARGAYQAGVLKRIGELERVRSEGNPFPIIGGASAGAINGAALAIGSDDFSTATEVLTQLWSGIQPSDVFRTDAFSQARNSITWIMDLSFGGVLGGGNAQSLLDATPLRHFLSKHVKCDRIQTNISRGHLYAFAISATNYNSGKSYLFIQGKKGHPIWNRVRRVTIATKITVEHLCASAAIPLVFPPVRLEVGQEAAFFGDGCIRLQQPLSPVIRLGADRILAIGVRGENTEHQNESQPGHKKPIAGAGSGSPAQRHVSGSSGRRRRASGALERTDPHGPDRVGRQGRAGEDACPARLDRHALGGSVRSSPRNIRRTCRTCFRTS